MKTARPTRPAKPLSTKPNAAPIMMSVHSEGPPA
ncbi:Uncharacterised protein [Mycobacteroides abscessus subsp. abscessus]|nr:Uncharacterised protein [Mycobacteroides abscessus subsp. abscessus]